jgi:hypothetical protein
MLPETTAAPAYSAMPTESLAMVPAPPVPCVVASNVPAPLASSVVASNVPAPLAIEPDARKQSQVQSISMVPPPSTTAPDPPTLQQQMVLAQSQLQALQLDMQMLIYKQSISPDPQDSQRMRALQQRILDTQTHFQTLLLPTSITSVTGPSPPSEAPLAAISPGLLHIRHVQTPSIAPAPLETISPALLHVRPVQSPSFIPAAVLDDMGFESAVLPPGPSGVPAKSSNPKPTKKAKATKSVKSQKKQAEDPFARMGSPSTAPKYQKDPTEETFGQMRSTTACSLPATHHTAPSIESSIQPAFPPPHSSTSQAAFNDTTMAVDPVDNGDDSMNAVFPGLAPFDTTDITLADINMKPEDLIPYPEELQGLLQAQEPLVDKRGGRPSSQILATVDEELANMDMRLNQLSKKTGISITNILKRWNTTKTRGGSLWNIYQKYFTANKAEETGRLGLDPTAKVTAEVRSQAYVAFRKAYPETWPQVLEVWGQYAELEGGNKSAQQRALAFRRTWRTICGIVSIFQISTFKLSTKAISTQAESAQRRHGFVLAAVMAGNEIHQDHSLVDIYEAKDATGVRRLSRIPVT